MSSMANDTTGTDGEARHIRVGYLRETWGDITLDRQDRPHFAGHESDALRDLYQSVTAQPAYQGLTPPQTLARMTRRMHGPVWAVAINAAGEPFRLESLESLES